MKRAFSFIVAAVALVVGFIVGGCVSHLDLPQYSTHMLVEAVRGGALTPGADLESVPLVKTRAEHWRTNAEGAMLLTMIYQDRHRIVLLESQAGKVREVTVWKYGSYVPEFHLSSQ